MNLEIARNRINDVIRPDAITESYNDFMITHVPLKKLQILGKFVILPKSKDYKTEDEIFDQLIRNEEDKHQFIIVYGNPGTGKSHLIRYFEEKFKRIKKENEVIIFIRRSDNTLKGTIRQLLEKPEVANMKNKDVYDRLVNATGVVNEEVLKNNIYYKFIIAADQNDDSYTITLSNIIRKQLIAFLKNEEVKEKLMSIDGPIERIYSKIAESKVLVDRDVVAEFKIEDFIFEVDFADKLESSGADRKAVAMAQRLCMNEGGKELSEQIAEYLNQFCNSVIQECAGLEAGDFKQVFDDIRRELYKQGKKLTLFIEDITSFTGVDNALLNALMEENTGMYSDQCRISSIVGTTIHYFDNNFMDNYKNRVSSFVYIPDDAFDSSERNGIFEFVGKYMNAMSLEQNVIDEWINNGGEISEYPVHNVVEGKYWDFVNIGDNKNLSLYPFTKNAIRKLYNEYLENGRRTPRYLLKEIIEPVVRDIMEDKSTFPKNRFPTLIDPIITMRQIVSTQLKGDDLERALRLMFIWGNNKPETIVVKNDKYIAGIKKEVYEELSLPIIRFNEIQGDDKQSEIYASENQSSEIPVKEEGRKIEDTITNSAKLKLQRASSILSKWFNGEKINASSSVGDNALIYNAKINLADFIHNTIDWQCEGISLDLINKIDFKNSFIMLEGQTRESSHIFMLERNMESMALLLAFIKWKEYGKESWDYTNSYEDIYDVTKWLNTNKDKIVKAVKFTSSNIERDYIEAAIASEMFRSILNGEYKEKNLSSYNLENLFCSMVDMNKSIYHSKEWNSLLNTIYKNSKSNKNSVTNYYNLKQGSGGSKVILESYELIPVFKQVKKSLDSITTYDETIKGCKDILNTYNEICNRLSDVVRAEKEKSKEDLELIRDNLNVQELEDEIDGLIQAVNQYNSSSSKVAMHIDYVDTTLLNQKRRKICFAVNRLLEAEQAENNIDVLLLYSSDPLSTIQPLIEVLKKMLKVLETANPKISDKKARLESTVSLNSENHYKDEKEWLKECDQILDSLINGGV